MVCSRVNFTSADVIGCPVENFTPDRSVKVYVILSADSVYPVASQGMTLFPLLVTVNSGWVICSMIQIELLSKTLVWFSDWASCGLAKIKLPPRTGLPLDAGELLEDALAPHPASSARALPAI